MLSLCRPWRHTQGRLVYFQLFLSLALVGDELVNSCPSHFPLGKNFPALIEWEI